jgi:hypothetical protein
MKIKPSKCEECGRPVVGFVDKIPGCVARVFKDKGQWDFTGDTEVNWNGQVHHRDPRTGQPIVCCEQGHEWPATVEGE